MFDWLRRALGAEPRPHVPATPLHGVEVCLTRDSGGLVSGFVVQVHNPEDGKLPDEALRQAINTLLTYAIQQDSPMARLQREQQEDFARLLRRLRVS